MSRLTFASCARVSAVGFLLWAGCSSGGAPPFDESSAVDLSQQSPGRDGGTVDMGMNPGSLCEPPCWLNPLPQGNYLEDVYRDAKGNGWAVGGNSLIRIEGDRTTLVRHPVADKQNFLSSVWGCGENEVWVAGTAVLHYDGKTWTDLPEFSWKGIEDVFCTGPSDVWLVGISGQIHHYDGKTWQKSTSGITTALRQISGSSPSNIWAGGDYGVLLFYNGSTWQKQTSPVTDTIGSLSCSDRGDCWMIPFPGVMYPGISGSDVYRLEGGRFVKQTVPASMIYYGVSAVSASEVWLAGTFDYLLSSGSWQKTTPQVYSLRSIAGQGLPSGRDQIGVGSAGLIGRFDGTAWRTLSSGRTEELRGTYSSPQGEQYFVGRSGSVGRIKSGQIEWQSLQGGSSSYYALWGISGSDIWAVGEYGHLAHFDGRDWTQLPERFGGSLEKLLAVSGSAASDVWAVGDQGTIVHYDGARWSTVTSGLAIKSLAGVYAASANDVWIGGADGKLGHFDGSKWTQWPKTWSKDIVAMWGASASDIWIAGGWTTTKDFFLARWNGSDWIAQTTPAGLTYPASISGTGPKDVWVGGHYGELVHFDGTSWAQFPLATNFTIFGVGQSQKTHYAIGDTGLIIQLDRR